MAVGTVVGTALNKKKGPKTTNKKTSPKMPLTGYTSNPRYHFADTIAGCPLIDTSVYAGVTHDLAGRHGCGFNGKSFNCDFWNLTRACDGAAAGEPGSAAMIAVCDALCDLVDGCDGAMLDHSYGEHSGLCTLHAGSPMLSEACFFYSSAGGVTDEAACAEARGCEICSRESKKQLSELSFQFESDDGNSATLSAQGAMASNGGVVVDGGSIRFLVSQRNFRSNFVVATANGNASPLHVSCSVPLMLNQRIELPGAGILVLVGFTTAAGKTELDLNCSESWQSYGAGASGGSTGGKYTPKAQPGANTRAKGARRYGVDTWLPTATEGYYGLEAICERNARGKTHGKTANTAMGMGMGGSSKGEGMGMGNTAKKDGPSVGTTPKKNGYIGRNKKHGSNKGMGMGMGMGTDADAGPFDSQATGMSRNVLIAGVAIVVVLFILGVGLGFAVKSSKATKKRRLAADTLVINAGLGAASETSSEQVHRGGARATRNPFEVEAFDWDPITAYDLPVCTDIGTHPPHLTQQQLSPQHQQQGKPTATDKQLASTALVVSPDMLRMTRLHSSIGEAKVSIHDNDVVQWNPGLDSPAPITESATRTPAQRLVCPQLSLQVPRSALDWLDSIQVASPVRPAASAMPRHRSTFGAPATAIGTPELATSAAIESSSNGVLSTGAIAAPANSPKEDVRERNDDEEYIDVGLVDLDVSNQVAKRIANLEMAAKADREVQGADPHGEAPEPECRELR